MNAEDVLKALEEIDFPDFIEPLRHSLQGLLLFWLLVNFPLMLAFSICPEKQ